ncbi:MAG: hypothetical protein KGJ35_02235 [Patescibacteria group bacterium]|nr:hypothetical protein [Patescibacteria group bacterium]
MNTDPMLRAFVTVLLFSVAVVLTRLAYFFIKEFLQNRRNKRQEQSATRQIKRYMEKEWHKQYRTIKDDKKALLDILSKTDRSDGNNCTVSELEYELRGLEIEELTSLENRLLFGEKPNPLLHYRAKELLDKLISQ